MTNNKKGITQRAQQTVAKKAAKLMKKNGGVTINLNGESPIAGYTYSPDKTTEFSVPENRVSQLHIDMFYKNNYDELIKDGNYFGGWHDGGKVYLDVSRNVINEHEAVVGAKASDQISIYDVKNGKAKYTANYSLNSEGVYQYSTDAQGGNEQTGNIKEGQGTPNAEGTDQKVNVPEPELTGAIQLNIGIGHSINKFIKQDLKLTPPNLRSGVFRIREFVNALFNPPR